MHLSVQFKIKSNPQYLQFLRENSYWYKILNRNPELFDTFVNEMKQKYHMTGPDKLNNLLSQIQLLQSFLKIIR